MSRIHRMIAQPSAQCSFRNENFVNTSKKMLKTVIELFRSALFHMKTRASLKYFVNECGFFSITRFLH